MTGWSGSKWIVGGLLALVLMLAYIPAPGSTSPVETASTDVAATPQTLDAEIEAASAGTRILLEEGQYGPIQIIDREDLHIVAAPGARVVISSGTVEDATAVRISMSKNITVAGVHIEKSYRGVTVDESSDVRLRDLAIDNVGQRGVHVENGSTRVVIEQSAITRTGTRFHEDPEVASVYASYGEGIYIGDGVDPTDRPSNVTIRNNYIADTGSEAIDIKTGSFDITIRGNVIEGSAARSGGAIAIHPGKAVSETELAAVVEHNIVRSVHAPDGEVPASAILVSGPAVVRANALSDIQLHGVRIDEVFVPETDADDDEHEEAEEAAPTQVLIQVADNVVFTTGAEPIYKYPHRELADDHIQIGRHLKAGPIDRLREVGESRSEVPDARIIEMLRDLTGDDMEASAPAPSATATPTRMIPPPATVAPQVTTTTVPVTQPPAPAPRVTSGRTTTPVYDTAWQMLVRGTPQQADAYFAELSRRDFTGAWAAIIHHRPATYLDNFAGGGQVGWQQDGQIVLNPDYVNHVRAILDAAQRHGQKVGLVAAWQNTYLPGGDTGVDQISNRVEGTVTTANARAYGRQIAEAFGDHAAVSMWVFGGDAGTNNTEANKAVWREMAAGVRSAGANQPINYHTPTVHFDQLNYVGEQWLDIVAPETGHSQGPGATEEQLRNAVAAYSVPVWAGEPRYFGIDFDWIAPSFRNPGVAEVRADAEAAKRAGVSGYLYGDAGRWAWCLFQTRGDTSPCNANNIAASFGPAEDAVINVFR